MANTISLLVREQLPEFIRTNYDTFTAFVEAYYEWMDQTGQTINLSKNIPSYLDLDSSLNAFITFFTQQYLPLFPADRLNSPAFAIEHAKEFYSTKGTAKAFGLLFRLFFGQNISVFYPKNNILRASTSGWTSTTSLRVDPTLWTIQNGDGNTTIFRALTDATVVTPLIYFNGVLQTSGYTHSPNRPFITYTTPPAPNTVIKTTYAGAKIAQLFNTNQIIVKFVGTVSGASAVTETMEEIVENSVTQIEIRVSSPIGSFSQSEVIHGVWTYDLTNQLTLDIYATLISYVALIQVTNGGTRYNIGDPVVITGGTPNVAATAVVDTLLANVLSNIIVFNGGVGFQPGQQVYITSSPNTGLNAYILSVDTSGNVHPNSYPIDQDVLSVWANTVLSNTNYFFPPTIAQNANTVMSIAFTEFIFGRRGPERLGPITAVTILPTPNIFNPPPILTVDAPVVAVTGVDANNNMANANVSLSYFGILGRMNVQTGGTGYSIGDEVSFVNIPGYGLGIGAAAEVTDIHSANTGIKAVRFQPSRVTGNVSVNIAVSNVQVTGTGTFFTTELMANDHIEINNESSYVSSITNDTNLIVNTALTKTSTLRKMGVYGHYFVGGMNYRMNHLPTVTVSSANPSATGATIIVDQLISGGQNVQLQQTRVGPDGVINTIRVTNHGYGYHTTPTIDLTGSGDGHATALAIMITNLFVAPGRFASTDGFLSSLPRLENANYFSNFSYVINSQTELSKYKNILKDLIHPAGMKLWGEYEIDSQIQSDNVTANIANTYTTAS